MSSYITILVKKAQKSLLFLQKFRKTKFQSQILVNFNRIAIESILNGYHKLAWVMTDPRQEGSTLDDLNPQTIQSITEISEARGLHRAQIILEDNTHPIHCLFTLLLPDRRYRSIC